ncbi:hypothetical protein CFC21_072814 [Triticum aestivum]|uniref:Serpin domain-containing protein n=2 Tax=Triticum aestivum TaxID=4565 RepID=A0A3B6LPT0_WHEAT|nr:hypothetical protein CFC21_072814 [Triticum aestivum]
MEEQQSAGMADLAARLTKRLADANSDRNLVFSPLSIYAALALLAVGAGGETLEEILRVLGARSRRELEDSVERLLDGSLDPDGGGPSVAFACGVWSDLRRPLKPAFRDAVVGRYKAEASSVDFRNDPEQARAKINAWAAASTRNLIDSAVPRGAVHRNTHLVLANAIYFRGKWEMPFYKSSTKDRPFHRHDGFKVLKLPYESSTAYTQRHSMCVFLPDARDGLAGLLDKITTSSPAGFLREHLPTRRVKVDQVLVPRFELSFRSSVTAVLKDLGLRLPFSHRADLSEMLDDGYEFCVQDVFQKAVIEVNEDGTKAAALTFYDVTAKSSQYPPEEVLFVADHPFAYFIIEEESHAILFAGHVVDPSDCTGAVIPSGERNTTKGKIDKVDAESGRKRPRDEQPQSSHGHSSSRQHRRDESRRVASSEYRGEESRYYRSERRERTDYPRREHNSRYY